MMRVLNVTRHYDAGLNMKPYELLLPMSQVEQIRVVERDGKFNIEAHTESEMSWCVWATYDTKETADIYLHKLEDYLNE